MNLEHLTATDYARAAQLAVAVLEGDDAMAVEAITAASDDPRDDSVTNLLLGMAAQTVDLMRVVIGSDAAGELLRTTLAQLREAENRGVDS
ncbi:hypothetical protein [uncultured Microbacterium sp.]|uniref:hypothetical protein n=1 Tax=uncultured Microbacterium sp. TaxID=191216 RepID=UPI0028D51768|nr:hypothetical protein [uncultured Microbacterium sp.]